MNCILPYILPGLVGMLGYSLLPFLFWALFLNDDDGVYGTDDFKPDLAQWKRAVLWWMRNPCHNLTFYVIGLARLSITSYGKYPSDVFAPNGGLNYAVRVWHFLPFPFISYHGYLKVYFGWRERGNFGIKLTKG